MVRPFQAFPPVATQLDATFDYLEASSQLTDSGSNADIDDADPVPIISGRKKNRRRLVDKSTVRAALLRLIKDDLDSWKEQDVLLQALATSFVRGQKCGKKEMKEISLQFLELKAGDDST